jgi:hypothetical protein
MSFKLDVKNWASATGQNVVDAKKGAAMTLIDRISKQTPIDLDDGGRLRNNWRTGINSRNGSSLMGVDPSGERSMSEAKSKIKTVVADETIVFSNNLPYAPVIEYGLYPNPPKKPTGKTINGFSTQAPKGMVRINVEKMALDMKREADALILAGKQL